MMKKRPAPSKKINPTKKQKRKPGRGSRQDSFPVVGIGASAGGVEACSDLLSNLPPHLGMAYVFVLHLSRDHVSHLSDVFQRKSSMPVVQAQDGMQVEPDHIYVIPPKTIVALDETGIKLKEQTGREVPYHPIDFFFFSLAEFRKDKSIGIILSGTATDGTLGLKTIKESGGLSFAQDETAGHNQMPRNAIEAGYVDFVGSPKAIAQQLSFLGSHPYHEEPPREDALQKDERIGNRTMIVNARKMPKGEVADESLILVSFEDITRYKKAEESLLETQEQLRMALIGGSVGMWAWHIETNEVLISSLEQQLYGLPDGASIRSYAEWEKYIHPLDLEATRRALEKSIEKCTPLDVEFRIKWPDGSTHWILAKANTYYDEKGAPEKMIGVHIDITERGTAIEALEESEKRFHEMSDNAPVMIWMTGPDKQTNFLNRTLLNFSGKTMGQDSGEGWFDGIHPEDKQAFLQAFDSSFETKREFKIDSRLRRYDGEYRWVMTHGAPRFSGDRFLGFIGTCIDITERIDLERQKDDFMGIASHELKTPVTSIKAYAQILRDKFRHAGDPLSANMLGRLDSQIDKLTNLINTLLDVAKIQSGQLDYNFEFFHMRDFIQELCDEMQPASPEHIIKAKVQADGKIFGDRARLGQVLRNLVSNAVKYSPDAKSVIVEARRQENDYVFSVQDFGVGIPKEMQDKVFGRFFRVDESAGIRVSGLGLGLFISAQIVKQHGGKLWLDSEPGKGSTFYFSLPADHQGPR